MSLSTDKRDPGRIGLFNHGPFCACGGTIVPFIQCVDEKGIVEEIGPPSNDLVGAWIDIDFLAVKHGPGTPASIGWQIALRIIFEQFEVFPAGKVIGDAIVNRRPALLALDRSFFMLAHGVIAVYCQPVVTIQH